MQYRYRYRDGLDSGGWVRDAALVDANTKPSCLHSTSSSPSLMTSLPRFQSEVARGPLLYLWVHLGMYLGTSRTAVRARASARRACCLRDGSSWTVTRPFVMRSSFALLSDGRGGIWKKAVPPFSTWGRNEFPRLLRSSVESTYVRAYVRAYLPTYLPTYVPTYLW